MQRAWPHCAIAWLGFSAACCIAQEPGTGSQLSRLLEGEPGSAFARAIEPRVFEFPADHGPHPAFRNEWWYFTGNLDDRRGRRFGYELTFFRIGLHPGPPADDSAWRSNQVYMAHFAVTDAHDERFYVAERYSRNALGLAGAAPAPFAVWIDDWSIRERMTPGSDATSAASERWTLTANDERIGVVLDLDAMKPPVLHGRNGLSQKSADRGNASYYYSITRWRSTGRLRIGSEIYAVSGESWLDREWSSSALGDDQVGWDWFALQLSDGSELMFYSLRKIDGSQDDCSAGTWIAADGSAAPVHRDEIDIVVTGTWESPAGGSYPSGWQLRLPKQDLQVEVTPVIANQELHTLVRYWEGAVDVRGRHAGNAVTGRGYVELTGYAEAP